MKTQLTPIQWVSQKINNLIMSLLVPLERPGGFFKWVFKFPILLDSIGLNRLIPGWILLLTTTGRRSGKQVITPVEFIFQKESGTYWIMSGWKGKTDWYKNVSKHPDVLIKVNREILRVKAVQLTVEEVLDYLKDILEINPGAIAIFSRWAGRPIDPTQNGLSQICGYFPGYSLVPVKPSE